MLISKHLFYLYPLKNQLEHKKKLTVSFFSETINSIWTEVQLQNKIYILYIGMNENTKYWHFLFGAYISKMGSLNTILESLRDC